MKPFHARIKFTINAQPQDLEIPAGMTALKLIRDLLGLKGTKEGCGQGECGACTIVVDGKAVNACLLLAAQLDGKTVLTVEGLSRNDTLNPLQQAFIDNHAVQCGFCSPGMLMSAHALITASPHPAREEIVKEISGNLCRCTGYEQIVAAIQDASKRLAEEKK